MLKSGKLSDVISGVAEGLIKSRAIGDLLIMFVTNDGQLLASSVANDDPMYDSSQRIAAVVASVATEYRAIDRIMHNEPFKSFIWSTGGRLVRCSHFCNLKDKGSVLLVISILVNKDEPRHNFLHSIAKRLEDDLLPSLAPIMETMISAPPMDTST